MDSQPVTGCSLSLWSLTCPLLPFNIVPGGRSSVLTTMSELYFAICAGNIYFNVHTQEKPDGLIRQQLSAGVQTCAIELALHTQ